MDLHKLKTFRTAALCLNFNQAARILNCAQSTISAQIKALEEEIGQPLFRRIKNKVGLTRAGEKMLGYANKLIFLEQEALADLNGGRSSRDRLSLMVPEALAATVLPDLARAFMVRYPKVALAVSNCSETGLEHDLQTDAVDLALVFSRQIQSPALSWAPLFTQNLALVAGPGHPLAGKSTLHPRDLESQTLFFPRAGCGWGVPCRQMLGLTQVRPAVIMEWTSIRAILSCVADGAGLALVPETSIQNSPEFRDLVALNWEKPLDIPVLMAWHRNKNISEALACFMDLVRNWKG